MTFATRRGLPLVAAILGTLALAWPAVALTWTAPVNAVSPTTEHSAFASGIVAIDDSTLVVNYVRGGQVYTRQSADNGATWHEPVRLSPNDPSYWRSEIASYGSAVGVVMGTSPDIRYARSTDGGATFSPSIALASQTTTPTTPHLAHGPGGLVAVVWTRRDHPNLFIRVSRDDGVTWDARQIVRPDTYTEELAVAIGDTGISVVVGTAEGMQLRQSADGITWGAWKNLGSLGMPTLGGGPTLSASGMQIAVGYAVSTSDGMAPTYKLSRDGGATWSKGIRVAKGAANVTAPHVLLEGAKLRVIYGSGDCSTNGCRLATYYRAKTASGWTIPKMLSPKPLYWSFPTGLVFSDRVVACYVHYPNDSGMGEYIQVRTGGT